MNYGSYMFGQTEKMSATDAALDGDALFTPKTHPLTFPDGSIPRIASGVNEGKPVTEMVYREHDDGSLTLLNHGVSPSYYRGGYATVVNSAEALFPGTCTGLKLHDGGKKLTFVQTISDEEHDLGGGDSLHNHLLWTASMDSTWPTAVHGFVSRPMCTNAIPFSAHPLWSQRRTMNHDLLMMSKIEITMNSADRFKEFTKNAAAMRAIDLNDRQYKRLLKKLFPAPSTDDSLAKQTRYDNKMAAIHYYWVNEVERVGSNAWAFFNAVQSYEYHTQTKGDAKKQDKVIIEANKPSTQVFGLVLDQMANFSQRELVAA